MLNYRAIIRGFAVDISTTFLFAATMVLVLLDPGASDVTIAERLYGSAAIDWTFLVGGLSFTALGAFVTGRMVPGRELSHASAVGCLSLLAALLSLGFESVAVDCYTFTGLVLTVPVAQLGGVLAGLYTAVSGAKAAE